MMLAVIALISEPNLFSTKRINKNISPDEVVTKLVKLRGGFSTEISVIKMEGEIFRLPENMWDEPYSSHYTNFPDEIDWGFQINVLWPKWEGATEENYFSYKNTRKESLQYVGQESKHLSIRVKRACRINRGSTLKCVARQRIFNYYKIVSGEGNITSTVASDKLIYSAEVPNLVAPNPPNIKFIGFRQKTKKSMEGKIGLNRYNKYIYMQEDSHEFVEYIVCSMPTNVPNPGCTLNFIWKEKFLINIRFVLPLLSEWEAIKNRSIEYLEIIIDKN